MAPRLTGIDVNYAALRRHSKIELNSFCQKCDLPCFSRPWENLAWTTYFSSQSIFLPKHTSISLTALAREWQQKQQLCIYLNGAMFTPSNPKSKLALKSAGECCVGRDFQALQSPVYTHARETLETWLSRHSLTCLHRENLTAVYTPRRVESGSLAWECSTVYTYLYRNPKSWVKSSKKIGH